MLVRKDRRTVWLGLGIIRVAGWSLTVAVVLIRWVIVLVWCTGWQTIVCRSCGCKNRIGWIFLRTRERVWECALVTTLRHNTRHTCIESQAIQRRSIMVSGTLGSFCEWRATSEIKVAFSVQKVSLIVRLCFKCDNFLDMDTLLLRLYWMSYAGVTSWQNCSGCANGMDLLWSEDQFDKQKTHELSSSYLKKRMTLAKSAIC